MEYEYFTTVSGNIWKLIFILLLIKNLFKFCSTFVKIKPFRVLKLNVISVSRLIILFLNFNGSTSELFKMFSRRRKFEKKFCANFQYLTPDKFGSILLMTRHLFATTVV